MVSKTIVKPFIMEFGYFGFLRCFEVRVEDAIGDIKRSFCDLSEYF